MASLYITPITKIHSTFAEAKEFFDKYGGVSLFDDEDLLSVDALAQAKRNLIVGEPGVGKSLLLGKIQEHLDAQGMRTVLISLRQPDAVQKINEFLADQNDKPKALLLDALDEVKSSNFPAVLQKIEEVSTKNPDLPLFLTGRWVFVSRYANSFPEYRFITISPFTHKQVRDYLVTSGRAEKDVDVLLNRIMSFSHRMLVVQIPRYLFYLDAYLQDKGVDAAAKVSRNKLFEYFIYRKLELEDKKLNADKREITKRVLEKLALTMELYQTNVITKDELMTFFDDLKSDLKRAALSQINLEVFYENSLLKVSQENLDKIEFENTEFQEYLAAKEITRFPGPTRAAFAFAVDPNINEIYPTWYNALTFLVDMQPDLLGQLIEFSGLRADKFKVMDEAFLTFIGRVDPRTIPVELRRQLFKDGIDYHERTLQWLPGQLAQALPGFFDASLEPYLKARIAAAEAASDTKRFVPLGNLSYVVAYLLQSNATLDRAYWRGKLLEYAADPNENGVLQRHALLGLQWLGDASVIDELPDLLGSEELVMREFLSLHTELAPDHPKSLEYAIKITKSNDIHGRYSFYALKEPASIKRFLQALVDDENFLREFLGDSSIFRDQDQVLVDKIGGVLDGELRNLCKQVLMRSAHHSVAYGAESSVFIVGLWKLLRKDDPGFVMDMVDRFKNSPDGKTGLYFASPFFVQVIEKEDVEPYVRAMLAADEAWSVNDVMLRIKYSKRPNAAEMYEAGRPFLVGAYKKSEEAQARYDAESPDKKRTQGLMEEFRKLLEPEPGKYSNGVFDFFNDHAKDLKPLLTKDDRDRIAKLLTDTIFKFMDPGKHKLTITAEHDGSKTYTTDRSVSLFGDAIRTAQYIGFDTSPYRQQIINHIPFAYNEELKTIFDLVKNIKATEMAPVIEVYRSRSSDLWRHNPDSFVRAVEQYHVTDAAPILRELVLDSAWVMHVRHEALPVVDSIAPDVAFLREVFEKFKDGADASERKLASIANGLLITNHSDSDAVKWRLRQVVDRAAAFIRPRGGHIHSIDDIEDEVSFGKKFAKPLMDLKYPGYEKDYLQVLDDAMDVWARGKEFQEYAGYLWEIVFAYFDNLKETRSYTPLQMYEEKVTSLKDRDGANWLARRVANLRRSYLGYLGKPANISEVITKYNEMREYDDKKIRNSADLFRHVQEAFDTDLRRWVEGEGAYDVLGYKIKGDGRQEYEKLIQKTLKAQVENVLLKRGFQVEVLREPQLLDEKRTDLLVRYGFAGPIVIEIKLSSNADIRGTNVEKSPSYDSMERYMRGFGASHGLFVVMDNIGAKNLTHVSETFQKISGVQVISLDCHKAPRKTPKKKAKKGAPKKRSQGRRA